MKITNSMLTIPPYISTPWKYISALHARIENDAYTLVVDLQNDTSVEVPGLSQANIKEIFETHARHNEADTVAALSPLAFNLTDGATIGSSMQHNPEQANFPIIPAEMLKKIASVTKALGMEGFLQKPEPLCNCIYCQISRSVLGEDALIEEVSEEDLKFKSWDVKQIEEQLYTVTNPLDANEHYNVFLGTPLGCTCGSKNCEHIRAVLSS